MMTVHALHFPNQQKSLALTRFESRLESLDRWGSGSNPRFLRRRPRNGWKRRCFASQLPLKAKPVQPKKRDSLLRQSLEAGLFGTYMLIFMASLWMLG